VTLSVLLSFTLFFYYKVNSTYEEEISLIKDIHHLRAKIKTFNNDLSIKGYIEITESLEGINVIGKVEGLTAGSTHAVHILEFSDISNLLDKSKVNGEYLRHYNPTNSPHGCPTNSQDHQDYHVGDYGNIIANNEGNGFISITKNVSIRSLNGRIIVITKSSDKCDPKQETDTLDDILAYGLLNAIKPVAPVPLNYKNEYFMREINTVNKNEFENKNNIHNLKPIISLNNNKMKPAVISEHVEPVKEEKQIDNESTKVEKIPYPKSIHKEFVKEKKPRLDVPKQNNENLFLNGNLKRHSNQNEPHFTKPKPLSDHFDSLHSDSAVQPDKNDFKPNKPKNNSERKKENNFFSSFNPFNFDFFDHKPEKNHPNGTSNLNPSSTIKPLPKRTAVNHESHSPVKKEPLPIFKLESNSNPFEHLNLNNPINNSNDDEIRIDPYPELHKREQQPELFSDKLDSIFNGIIEEEKKIENTQEKEKENKFKQKEFKKPEKRILSPGSIYKVK